ncbi:MFS transporter [Acetobacter persici]|uniref:MFS transporter n=1 Tax=Acetobacter persici TaxID=1076596 RepID=UPI0039E858CF
MSANSQQAQTGTFLPHQERHHTPKIIAVSLIGASMGAGTLSASAFSVLLPAITQTYHWGQAKASFAITFEHWSGAAGGILIGFLIDRFGIRRTVLPLALLSGIILTLIKTTGSDIWQFWLFYALLGIIGPGIAPYSKLLSGWFSNRRGLALGSFGSGIFLSMMITPQVVRSLYNAVGWQNAYAVLGLASLVTLPFLFAFLKDPPRSAEQKNPSLPGKNLHYALRTPIFWLLFVTVATSMFVDQALFSQYVSIFLNKGFSLNIATTLLSCVAAGAILAQIMVGWLLDIQDRPQIIVPFALMAFVGLIVIHISKNPLLLFMASFLLGLGSGGETSMTSYFVGRYFGLSHFGKIYACLYSLIAIVAALSPPAIGWIYDKTGSYSGGLLLLEIIALLSLGGFILLPAYTYPKR